MRSRLLLLFSILLYCISACQKNTVAPATSQLLIEGKWFIASHTSSVYTQGKLVDTVNTTAFNTDDFIEYYSDGSGYVSSKASPSPSLKLFKYTISGLNLVQINLDGSSRVAETITILTANNLSYHYTIAFSDDNGQQYTEADTYTCKKL